MAFVRIRSTISGFNGGPGLNTFYFTGVGPTPTAAEINDAGARVRAFWFQLAGFLPVGVQVQVQSTVDIIDPANGALLTGGAIAPVPPAVIGTAAGDPMPPGIQMVMTNETGLVVARRRVRGRTFLGPISEAVVTGGILPVATATSIVTAANALRAISPTVVLPVVWIRPKITTPGSTANISSFSVASKLGHLRSRRDG